MTDAAADAAFEGWGGATPQERSNALLKIADAIDARADELVAVEVKDTGKPIGLTASEELPPSSDHFRFFAGAARVLEGKSAGEYMEDHTSWIRREPVGVVGQVTPWNYPLMMMIWKIAPALAAGNTIVLKPSDTTPASSVLLGELAQEFLPPAVLNIVTGDRDSYQLVRDPHIKVLYNRRGVSDYALYDEAGILERTGVTPTQYPEYAALRGDPSDNLPGVPGIGEKTAPVLLSQMGSMQAVWADIDHCAGANLVAALDSYCEEEGLRRIGTGLRYRPTASRARTVARRWWVLSAQGRRR